MRHRTLAALLILGTAAPALAQDAQEDWDLIRQPEQKTTLAYIPTTTGLGIGFRCVDGVFGAVIAGLPAAGGNDRTRILRMKVGDDELADSVWNVTTDRTVALADYPASLARDMRDGGPVTIVIPRGSEDGRNIRHELQLPGSSAAIDETLTACGRPLVDPRDALLPEIGEGGLPEGVTWARPPRPRYPLTQYLEGVAVVTCVLQPDGSLDQCAVESEFPVDGRFGRAALRGVDRARLTSPAEVEGAYRPRIIGFRTIFTMQ
ncbi:TonB family protein [Brevundimonas subvibrioides ATCC 15264]|uniref:TonB family protein n=2 Tax=Brevundimonas subvibrioides TaxID=74313 RepID=D9QLT0_BRESC|nr:TonB family protein [Brevundimonas subvibrioides ATCC 15264]